MSTKSIPFPKMIDEPMMIFFWQIDEFLLPIVAVSVGILIEQAFLCFMASLLLIKQYKKFKDNNPAGFIEHYLYWQGFFRPKKSLSFIKSFHRRFYT